MVHFTGTDIIILRMRATGCGTINRTVIIKHDVVLVETQSTRETRELFITTELPFFIATVSLVLCVSTKITPCLIMTVLLMVYR